MSEIQSLNSMSCLDCFNGYVLSSASDTIFVSIILQLSCDPGKNTPTLVHLEPSVGVYGQNFWNYPKRLHLFASKIPEQMPV